jgi:hypothetical protein
MWAFFSTAPTPSPTSSSLSFNKISITRDNFDNLLINLAQYNNLKILNFESMCFPSFTIISTIDSLEELSLSHLWNNNRKEYMDKDLFILSSLKNLKVLILYYRNHKKRVKRVYL